MKRIKRKNLDVRAWDQLVSNSTQGELSMYSWYLDIVCVKWDALVLEENGKYLAGFALPWKTKLGIKYIYPPFFIQAFPLLGEVDKTFIDECCQYARNNFAFCELYTRENLGFGKSKERANYVLDLSASYAALRHGYSSNHLRNLKKAKKAGVSFRATDVQTVIDLFRKDRGSSVETLKDKDYERLAKLYNRVPSENIIVQSAYLDDQLLCAMVVLKYKDRLCFTFSGNSTEAKEVGAMFYLMDDLIYNHAEQNLILDFDGSENEGIARFYAGWGAVNEPYHFERFNQLPFPLNAFKPD